MLVHLPDYVLDILKKLEGADFEAYIVGGAVRDILMGKEVYDWDFTTNATPEQILKVFPEGFYDNTFGTVGISHPSSPNPYEITTFRKEFGYSDSRRPDKIEWGKTLKDDVARRDFTINAMALTAKSELIDYYEGQKDLKRKIIRAVGNPDERFSEDALRMMRAIRIAAELGFTIEEKTLEAIKKNAALINRIAKERVKEELFKLLKSPHPYDGVLVFKNSGLMAEILPEMEKAFGVEQKSPGRHHIYDVGEHLLISLKNCKSPDPLVRFATLIHDIGKPATYKKLTNGTITFYNHEVISTKIAENISDRLKFPNKERERLITLVRWHQFTVDERQTDSAIRRFIRNVSKENLEDMLALRVADRLGGGAAETSWRLEEFKKRLIEVQKEPFSVRDLKIDGNDVMKVLRLGSGPRVGEILNKLFEEVVEKKLDNTKEALLERLKEISAS
ncbi:HD domain-containing protein [Patescibacteria group bacterium]|nr:HD domain-containing protein [Patescibacteria group bacterium]